MVQQQITRKELFSTVFAQQFSPCGNYLVAGNSLGKIAVYHITNALSMNAADNPKFPVNIFQAHNNCIYCMASNDQFLITGGSKQIHGWAWKEVLHHTDPKPKWSLQPSSGTPFDTPETNSITINKEDESIIAGCGDNNVYVWDLSTGENTQTLRGHRDYVHTVSYLQKDKQIISGGEDGLVKFWDLRNADCVEQIEPNKLEQAQRASLGAWVSCLDVSPSEDWMVCGGAAHLSVWHLRSKTSTATLSTTSSCPQVVKFEDDFILSGGTEPAVFKWSINGELRGRFPCTPKSIFSLEVNKTLNCVLAISGTSHQVDISTNFDYKAFSLQFRQS